MWDNDWERIGDIGKKYDFEWGGDWTGFVDNPHFEISFGFGTNELLKKYNNGEIEDGYIVIN